MKRNLAYRGKTRAGNPGAANRSHSPYSRRDISPLRDRDRDREPERYPPRPQGRYIPGDTGNSRRRDASSSSEDHANVSVHDNIAGMPKGPYVTQSVRERERERDFGRPADSSANGGESPRSALDWKQDEIVGRVDDGSRATEGSGQDQGWAARTKRRREEEEIEPIKRRRTSSTPRINSFGNGDRQGRSDPPPHQPSPERSTSRHVSPLRDAPAVTTTVTVPSFLPPTPSTSTTAPAPALERQPTLPLTAPPEPPVVAPLAPVSAGPSEPVPTSLISTAQIVSEQVVEPLPKSESHDSIKVRMASVIKGIYQASQWEGKIDVNKAQVAELVSIRDTPGASPDDVAELADVLKAEEEKLSRAKTMQVQVISRLKEDFEILLRSLLPRPVPAPVAAVMPEPAPVIAFISPRPNETMSTEYPVPVALAADDTPDIDMVDGEEDVAEAAAAKVSSKELATRKAREGSARTRARFERLEAEFGEIRYEVQELDNRLSDWESTRKDGFSRSRHEAIGVGPDLAIEALQQQRPQDRELLQALQRTLGEKDAQIAEMNQNILGQAQSMHAIVQRLQNLEQGNMRTLEHIQAAQKELRRVVDLERSERVRLQQVTEANAEALDKKHSYFQELGTQIHQSMATLINTTQEQQKAMRKEIDESLESQQARISRITDLQERTARHAMQISEYTKATKQVPTVEELRTLWMTDIRAEQTDASIAPSSRRVTFAASAQSLPPDNKSSSHEVAQGSGSGGLAGSRSVPMTGQSATPTGPRYSVSGINPVNGQTRESVSSGRPVDMQTRFLDLQSRITSPPVTEAAPQKQSFTDKAPEAEPAPPRKLADRLSGAPPTVGLSERIFMPKRVQGPER